MALIASNRTHLIVPQRAISPKSLKEIVSFLDKIRIMNWGCIFSPKQMFLEHLLCARASVLGTHHEAE